MSCSSYEKNGKKFVAQGIIQSLYCSGSPVYAILPERIVDPCSRGYIVIQPRNAALLSPNPTALS